MRVCVPLPRSEDGSAGDITIDRSIAERPELLAVEINAVIPAKIDVSLTSKSTRNGLRPLQVRLHGVSLALK